MPCPNLVSGRAEFTPDGIQVSYIHFQTLAGEEGFDLKERAVVRLRKTGRTGAYIGAGLPDLPAARRADLVFARGRLEEAFRKHGIAYRPCAEFHGIIATLAEMLA